MSYALRYLGNGQFSAAHPKAVTLIASECEEGRVYAMTCLDDRLPKSHRHLFAVIADAWQSLPEDGMTRFPSPLHLRKVCAIKAGWCNRSEIVCRARADAVRAMADIQEMDEYAVFELRENIVLCWRARSMSYKALKGVMKFQELKDLMLIALSQLTGIDAAAEYERRLKEEA